MADDLNPEQSAAVRHIDGPLLVLAGYQLGRLIILEGTLSFLTIGIRPPTKGRQDAAIDLDGRFGLFGLRDELRRTPRLEAGRAVEVFRGVSSAVDAAHREHPFPAGHRQSRSPPAGRPEAVPGPQLRRTVQRPSRSG